MFRIKRLSAMALAALGLAILAPSLALGHGHHGGLGGVMPYRLPGIGLGGYGLGGFGGVLPYRIPGYGLGGYGLGGYGLGGYGGYGLSYYGLGGYGLGAYNLSGGGALGYGLGMRYGLGRGYSGIGVGVGNPGYYYYGAGAGYPSSAGVGQVYPNTPLQPYGSSHPYGSGVYNYGGANPDYRQSGYAPPTAAREDPPARREEASVAHLQVIVPTADAQLWVNDARTRQQGKERAFVSPTLNAGKKFAYELRARWTDRTGRQLEQSRSIVVQAGDRQVVDFTRPQGQEEQQPAPEQLQEQPPAPPIPPAPQDRPEP